MVEGCGSTQRIGSCRCNPLILTISRKLSYNVWYMICDICYKIYNICWWWWLKVAARHSALAHADVTPPSRPPTSASRPTTGGIRQHFMNHIPTIKVHFTIPQDRDLDQHSYQPTGQSTERRLWKQKLWRVIPTGEWLINDQIINNGHLFGVKHESHPNWYFDQVSHRYQGTL